MARPRKCKKVCSEPAYDSFIPEGISVSGDSILSVEEFEVVRLIDYERLTQEQCATQMGVGRTTITDMYDKAHFKIADSLINGRKLIISGGSYEICTGNPGCVSNRKCCRKHAESYSSANKNSSNANEKDHNGCKDNHYSQIRLIEKGDNQMRVAVTYDNGEIFQHFGHTEQFKVYDITDGKIVNEQVVDTNGQGHGALAGFLFGGNVDTLICGGIGGGAQMALADAGIKLYGGVSGSADEAVKALIAGTLGYNPDVHCDHHNHEHCGEGHQCGNH